MKNSKIVLDTSFISSLYNPSDANHKEAIEWADEIPITAEIIVPIPVLFEVSLMIKQYPQFTLKNILLFINDLGARIKYINKGFSEDYLEFIDNNKIHLKTLDSIILFSAVQENANLVTFDDKLLQTYKKFLK